MFLIDNRHLARWLAERLWETNDLYVEAMRRLETYPAARGKNNFLAGQPRAAARRPAPACIACIRGRACGLPRAAVLINVGSEMTCGKRRARIVMYIWCTGVVSRRLFVLKQASDFIVTSSNRPMLYRYADASMPTWHFTLRTVVYRQLRQRSRAQVAATLLVPLQDEHVIVNDPARWPAKNRRCCAAIPQVLDRRRPGPFAKQLVPPCGDDRVRRGRRGLSTGRRTRHRPSNGSRLRAARTRAKTPSRTTLGSAPTCAATIWRRRSSRIWGVGSAAHQQPDKLPLEEAGVEVRRRAALSIGQSTCDTTAVKRQKLGHHSWRARLATGPPQLTALVTRSKSSGGARARHRLARDG